MKRILSVLLMLLLIAGMVNAAVADRTFADIGKSMSETSTELFKRYMQQYPDGKGLTDEDIDRLYEFHLYYCVGQITYQLEISHDRIYGLVTSKEHVQSSVTGWEMIMNSIMDKHAKYMNGEVSKEEFSNLVFSLAKSLLATADSN